jgi:hypothetical protein
VQNEFFNIRRAEMEYASLVVIDPDHGMKMMGAHEFLSNNGQLSIKSFNSAGWSELTTN